MANPSLIEIPAAAGGGGTVTSVSGTANQIDVATGTTTPVISLDPVITLPGTINKYTLTAPATAATLTIANNKVLTASNTLTLAGTDGTTITFQATDTYVGRATTDTLTNKTLTSPVITTPTITGAVTRTGQAAIIAPTSAIANTQTIITQSAAALAANRLVAGTVIHIRLFGEFTAAGAAAPTWIVHIGTAGTTSDASALSVTGPNSVLSAGAIPFYVDITVTITAVGSGTSATCVGQYTHANQGSTGIAVTASTTVKGTPAGFDTTAANFVSVSFKSGNASNNAVFNQALILYPNL